MGTVEEAALKANDLSLLYLLCTSTNNENGLLKLYKLSIKGSKFNIAFNILFYLGDVRKCVDLLVETNKIPQAAMLARAYCPSKIEYVTKIWKENLQSISPSAANALGTPQTHPDCFPVVGDYVEDEYDDQEQDVEDVEEEEEDQDIVQVEKEIQEEQPDEEKEDEEEEIKSEPEQQQIDKDKDTNDIDLSDDVSLPSGIEDNESDILNGDDDDDEFNI